MFPDRFRTRSFKPWRKSATLTSSRKAEDPVDDEPDSRRCWSLDPGGGGGDDEDLCVSRRCLDIPDKFRLLSAYFDMGGDDGLFLDLESRRCWCLRLGGGGDGDARER